MDIKEFVTTDTGYSIKDSGVHHDFNSGSRRDSQEGKPFPDLISMFMLKRLGAHYAAGAKKYAARNWELGQPTSQYIRSCLRHLIEYMIGKREEDHLAAAIWNLAGAIHNEELVKLGLYDKEILDTPDYTTADGFHQTIKVPALKENAKRKAEQDAKDAHEPKQEGECSNESPSELRRVPAKTMFNDWAFMPGR